jgi:hypothetical protein
MCVEFPSLSWLADTPEKALKGIRNLVADVLLDMGKTTDNCQLGGPGLSGGLV